MKGISIYKGVVLLTMSTTLLSGCGKVKEVEYQENIVTEDDVIDNKPLSVEERKFNVPSEPEQDNMIEASLDDLADKIESGKSSDEIIIDYFNESKEQINNYLESDNYQDLKENVIQTFITLTDFIFYDTEINGIKYSDLKDTTKENLNQTYQDIDYMIMSKFPDYKENINEKYNSAKEWLNNKYNDVVNEEVREVITEINENDKEVIESVADYADDVYEDGKIKVKTWYEGVKLDYE